MMNNKDMGKDEITLMANSGIQFHSVEIEIDDKKRIKPMYFMEKHKMDGNIVFGYAYYDGDDDKVYQKSKLDFDENGKITTSKQIRVALNQNSYFVINNIIECISQFENKWLPIPFFKYNVRGKYSTFGPTGWSRIKISKINKNTENSKREDSTDKYLIVVAFDTKIDDKQRFYYALKNEDTKNEANIFALCNDENHSIDFLNKERENEWVEEYLATLGNSKQGFPKKKYLGQYLYLIKYLSENNIIPKVILYSDDSNDVIDVDFVLDIGNSKTCGLLFENPQNGFNFDSVQKLLLRDLSNPETFSDKPFSMRLVFAKANFGDFEIPGYPNLFIWPSFLRVGNEAQKLINRYNISNYNLSNHAITLSSPKRYLWDTDKVKIPWEFVNNNSNNALLAGSLKNPIYIKDLSEQFKTNGEIVKDNEKFSLDPYYSRNSLMTLVFIEIFNHAFSQVNSNNVRSKNKQDINKPRRIKRVVITCPTAMVQKEQILLRKAAENAIKVLHRYYNPKKNDEDNDEITNIDVFDDFNNDLNFDNFNKIGDELEKEENVDDLIKVVPGSKDIKYSLQDLENRKEWIYDEASASQIVFLFSKLAIKYKLDPKRFFNLYGKKREGLTFPGLESVTIATIDIGGGTTDLMINAYQYNPEINNSLNLKPHPLYWESFDLAGDDLIKEIVQQIIIERIVQHANEKNCIDVIGKTIDLFGEQTASLDYIHYVYRKNIVSQILVPIAIKYLEHSAVERIEDKLIKYNEIFQENKPNEELITYINDFFGNDFNFEEIEWELSISKVNEIIEIKFSSLFRKISSIVNFYDSDFLVIAGKPSKIPKIKNLFKKYAPIDEPNKIISLYNYFIGRWYPYSDSLGYLKDPKTTVAVGGVIFALAGKYKEFSNFTIDTSLLKTKLVSTADFIGLYNSIKGEIKTIYLNPDNVYGTEKIKIDALPLFIGYKQMEYERYRARPLYHFAINETKIMEKIIEDNPGLDEKTRINKVKTHMANLKKRMPYEITISRDYSVDKEEIKIENIVDNNNNPVSRSFFRFKLMTLSNKEGYWLDTGEFILNLK